MVVLCCQLVWAGFPGTLHGGGPMSSTDSLPYRSPISKLVQFFRRSRDNWKAKCKAAKRENKSLKTRLAKMKERAILINTARGNIVDEQALADAIKSGHLGGAAVDAFANESDIQNCPLIGLENVLLTPHMCSRSPELVKRVDLCVNENLDNLYYGRELVRVVN